LIPASLPFPDEGDPAAEDGSCCAGSPHQADAGPGASTPPGPFHPLPGPLGARVIRRNLPARPKGQLTAVSRRRNRAVFPMLGFSAVFDPVDSQMLCPQSLFSPGVSRNGCECFRYLPLPDSSSHAIRVPVLPFSARRSNMSASTFRCVMLLALGHSILSVVNLRMDCTSFFHCHPIATSMGCWFSLETLR
jgi:hypothetical protein